MKKNRSILPAILSLVFITAIATAVHLSTRISAPEGVLTVEADGQVKEIVWEQLPLIPVQGTLVNGKGEDRTVDAQGILLLDVLKYADVSIHTEATVIAEDAYHAVVTRQEVFAEGQVYLAVQEDGGVQLVVFGDSNSKRNVSDVERLVVS